MSFATVLPMKKNAAFRFVVFTSPVRCLSAVILFSLLTSCRQERCVGSFSAMNTYMSFLVYSENYKKGESCINLCQSEIASIEQNISTTIQTSDVSRINRSGGNADDDFLRGKLPVSFDVFELLDFSNKMYQASSGTFNPALYPVIKEWGFTTGEYRVPSAERITALLKNTRLPEIKYGKLENGGEAAKGSEKNFYVQPEKGMQLDFGAVGKGYAGDRAISVLKENGIKSALLDLGGNVQALGRKPDGSLWKIGIKNPWGGKPVCSLEIADCAVITSGGYERFFTGADGKKYIHIFDSVTGHPVDNELESVTIVCKSGLYADALSTTLFAMGSEKAFEFWKKNCDFDFILVKKDKSILYSEGLCGKIGIADGFTGSEVSLK